MATSCLNFELNLYLVWCKRKFVLLLFESTLALKIDGIRSQTLWKNISHKRSWLSLFKILTDPIDVFWIWSTVWLHCNHLVAHIVRKVKPLIKSCCTLLGACQFQWRLTPVQLQNCVSTIQLNMALLTMKL